MSDSPASESTTNPGPQIFVDADGFERNADTGRRIARYPTLEQIQYALTNHFNGHQAEYAAMYSACPPNRLLARSSKPFSQLGKERSAMLALAQAVQLNPICGMWWYENPSYAFDNAPHVDEWLNTPPGALESMNTDDFFKRFVDCSRPQFTSSMSYFARRFRIATSESFEKLPDANFAINLNMNTLFIVSACASAIGCFVQQYKDSQWLTFENCAQFAGNSGDSYAPQMNNLRWFMNRILIGPFKDKLRWFFDGLDSLHGRLCNKKTEEYNNEEGLFSASLYESVRSYSHWRNEHKSEDVATSMAVTNIRDSFSTSESKHLDAKIAFNRKVSWLVTFASWEMFSMLWQQLFAMQVDPLFWARMAWYHTMFCEPSVGKWPDKLFKLNGQPITRLNGGVGPYDDLPPYGFANHLNSNYPCNGDGQLHYVNNIDPDGLSSFNVAASRLLKTGLMCDLSNRVKSMWLKGPTQRKKR